MPFVRAASLYAWQAGSMTVANFDEEAAWHRLAKNRQSLIAIEDTVCHVRMVGDSAFVATDVDVNIGPSVVNAVEALAHAIEDFVGHPVQAYQYHRKFLGKENQYEKVMVADGTHRHFTSWEDIQLSQIEEETGHHVPGISYSREELGWIQGEAARLAAAVAADQTRRRAMTKVYEINRLREPGVAAREQASKQDWPRIARLSCECRETGIDPLDMKQVEDFADRADLSVQDRHGFISLFQDPIYHHPRGYINGRHRIQAMLEAGVKRVVIRIDEEVSGLDR